MLVFDPLDDEKSSIILRSHTGTDQFIAEVAKNSTSSTFEGMSEEEIQYKVERLLTYLYKNHHTSPFEFSNYTFLVKAPLFVIQQILRHRTFRFNQASERFSILPTDYYIPKYEVIEGQSSKMLQCRDGEPVDAKIANEYVKDLEALNAMSNDFKDKYKCVVANEIVRLATTTNLYSKMAINADLSNLLKFIRNRIAENAQYEIRQYAKCFLECISIYNPLIYKCFINENL